MKLNPQSTAWTQRPSIWPLALFLSVAGGLAQEWPEWRGGPGRDGRWAGAAWPTKIPESGPRTIWKQTIGTGYAGPAVAAGRVYVMDRLAPPRVETEVERINCFDAKDGHTVWTRAYPCVLKLSSGYANGPRATPTIRNGKVYAMGGMGNLSCLDAATGDLVWEKDLRALYNALVPPWGVANAPWIEGNNVVVQAGGPTNATIMAFNKSTGDEIWRSLSDRAGYAAITGVDSGGTRQLIVWTASGVYSLNPKNGEAYWKYPRVEAWDQTVATPIFDAKSNRLIICSDREGATALQLGAEKPGFEKLWENFAISALHSTPVLRDGFVYGINHNGAEANNCGEFRCVELATGRVAWAATNVTEIGKFAQAHVTLNTANDTFYISNALGELVIAKADPAGYHELARAQITGKTWSHPAYAEGRIYARGETSLVCISLAP